MHVYIYATDIYCEDCGKHLASTCFAPTDPDDSNQLPQGPFPVGEADSPQHCGAGADCLNFLELSDGSKVGLFFENELTAEGKKYVREASGEVAELWADFYDLRTGQKLIGMLTENTGRHFLDSGSAYGRHWQQNQKIDFENQPEGKLEFWNRKGKLDIVPTLSVYHFLKERLDYNQELDKRYQKYVEDNDLCLDLQSAQLFVDSIGGKGLYGDGGPTTINTYNNEDLLSQIIQYVYWSDSNGDTHVMLQIHGGCDARGGYTDPVAFDCNATDIFDNAFAAIYCPDCGKFWSTDNSYNWTSAEQDLEDYTAVDEKPDYPKPPDPKQQSLPIDLPEQPDIDVESIWVDEDKNGHCPHCSGILNIAPYPCS